MYVTSDSKNIKSSIYFEIRYKFGFEAISAVSVIIWQVFWHLAAIIFLIILSPFIINYSENVIIEITIRIRNYNSQFLFLMLICYFWQFWKANDSSSDYCKLLILHFAMFVTSDPKSIGRGSKIRIHNKLLFNTILAVLAFDSCQFCNFRSIYVLSTRINKNYILFSILHFKNQFLAYIKKKYFYSRFGLNLAAILGGHFDIQKSPAIIRK